MGREHFLEYDAFSFDWISVVLYYNDDS